ncbi:MAG: elongation factor 1-alpha [archaeon GW2011_AR21]|uniref:Elongation factor 1-alpha n=1 Tax=Candidatus Iainarchaeum sp. TaxID=3101447 RepID=A0A7J4KTS1_9ARCH|nr:MAG: elongation factor 1-alpha [archaeon GW2011_AR21]HIH21663.1 translation elongation factor EF-1 subunit alpha [Candidatus Diapherotrites archaeon]HIH33084.1 translation elongation factor EF-1 subunit alpha [Candidatus Diapherotrites archaeon]
MAVKPHINLIFIGHVDHGKSTLVGRTLYDTGALSEQDYRKLKQEAEERGKGTFAFAYAMDQLKEERERGVTIDLAYRKFDLKKNTFTIIDAPGHKDFVKNMITGTSQADAAVLVIAAKEGIQPQTKEHAFLAQVMGLKQLIVALNKMDEVNYDQGRYNQLKTEIEKLLTGVGYKPEQFKIIPVSAWIGDNVVKKSAKLPWFNGQTLIEALDEITAPAPPTDKPLRLPIQDVYNIKGVGTVPVGRVETGILKPGETIIFMPSGKQGEVKSIEMHHEQLEQALPGDNIGFNVRGIAKADVARGDVAGHTKNIPTVAKEFIAQIVVLNHPTAIPVNYTPVFHMHTAQLSCVFSELQKSLDPKTGQAKEENPKFLKTGDAAIVKITPTRPVCVETFKEFPQLGRFAVRDMGQTVAAGIILSITKK